MLCKTLKDSKLTTLFQLFYKVSLTILSAAQDCVEYNDRMSGDIPHFPYRLNVFIYVAFQSG